MKLIYRALVLDVAPRSVQPYRKPQALNWRYQVLGETYGDAVKLPAPTRLRQAQAMNWRFRMAMGV